MLLEAVLKTGARARNLMKLGLSREDAVPLASSSRGPWFMSKRGTRIDKRLSGQERLGESL